MPDLINTGDSAPIHLGTQPTLAWARPCGLSHDWAEYQARYHPEQIVYRGSHGGILQGRVSKLFSFAMRNQRASTPLPNLDSIQPGCRKPKEMDSLQKRQFPHEQSAFSLTEKSTISAVVPSTSLHSTPCIVPFYPKEQPLTVPKDPSRIQVRPVSGAEASSAERGTKPGFPVASQETLAFRH